jgi:5,10-methylenetetrahydromethanopterin reductase
MHYQASHQRPEFTMSNHLTDRSRAQRLGAYLLPGRSNEPLRAISQAIAGEDVGLGAVWLSERAGTKDMGTVGGALAQGTHRVTIGAAVTHFQTRHPLALASLGITMQALSGERFVLGVGRSIPILWKAWGLPPTTNQLLIDGVDMLRRLWTGERVKYDGPLGTFPSLQLVDLPAVAPPPVLLAAIGPVSLRMAGEHFDGAILHPFLTTEAQQRAVDAIHEGARSAGRDVAAVRVVSTVVCAPDQSQEETDMRLRARLVTYLNSPGLAESLVKANGWDLSVLQAVAEHPLIAPLGRRPADGVLDHAQLIEVSRVVPEKWFEEAAAAGTSAQVAVRLAEYLDAGADDVIIHGSPPDLLGPTVDAVNTL